MILTLRTADTSDLIAAQALLYRAVLASPNGRLLGSATTGCRATFGDLLTAGLCYGRVDLAVSGDRIDGVACWIDHPHGPVAPTTRVARNGLDDLHARLHTIDLVIAVPDREPHQHLACLGTRPDHTTARAVTDLLLHHQRLLNDRHGHTLYTEVHDPRLRVWLHRSGYADHGVSLGTDTHPDFHLLSYTGTNTTRTGTGDASPSPTTDQQEQRRL